VILVVLCAGRGSRLGDLTRPKIVVTVSGGRSLLDFTLEAVDQVGGLARTLLVTGFASEAIEAAVGRKGRAKPVAIRYNPFYEVAGPIASIWLSRVWAEASDFLVCNGDTYYSQACLSSMAGLTSPGVYLGIERGAGRGPDDMRVLLSANGELRRVGKDLSPDLADGISAGLLAVVGASARLTVGESVDAMVRSPEWLAPTTPWHHLCNVLVDRGIPVGTVPLEPGGWHEVDSSEDLAVLRTRLEAARIPGAKSAFGQPGADPPADAN